MKYFFLIPFILIFSLRCISKQSENEDKSSKYLGKTWKQVATEMPAVWYGSYEAKMVADSVLKYQTDIGGWAKNSGFHIGKVKQDEWERIVKYGIGATFDNGATLTEMKFLTNIYAQTKDKRYRDAFMKGYNYIFLAQYCNGGWPQFYPPRKQKSAYSSNITFNDNAMVNIMRFLEDIIKEDTSYAPLQINTTLREMAAEAFNMGIDCILRTQIIVDGQPTVWCAQHDEHTLEPAGARSYELPSYSGSESVGITLLLMDIENPSQDIIRAIEGAVQWFSDHKIEGIRIQNIETNGQRDRIVVEDVTAPPLWARFYDLKTEEPFFCDRDGIKKETLAEIGLNRRGGYRWYTDAPNEVLEKYPDWKERIDRNK